MRRRGHTIRAGQNFYFGVFFFFFFFFFLQSTTYSLESCYFTLDYRKKVLFR